MNINIAFESGGIRGLAYLGVIKYLEERGYRIFKASGCSVGAIFAGLVIAGYNYQEIEQLIEQLEVNEIVEVNNFKEGIRGKGINNISKLEEKLAVILANKNIKTFQDLKYGDDYLLKIVVTDNKKKEAIILPNDLIKYKINPDTFKISKAIAMSCSIPLVYSHYKLGENIFVDGGATYRFPLELVCDGKRPVLGVKFSRKNNVVFDFFQKKIYKIKSNKLEGNNVVILEIDTKGLQGTQFSKGLKKRHELYMIGYNCAKNNLNRK